jgi:hypothetical protein
MHKSIAEYSEIATFINRRRRRRRRLLLLLLL